jgi:glutamate 5-kinase
MQRQGILTANRIVVKIGTHSLLNDQNKINYYRIDRLALALSTLIQQGKEVILVTSGAIGVGSVQMGLQARPTEMAYQQATAAVGQVALMNLYSRSFNYYKQYIGQILLTRDIIDFPDSYNNYKNAMNALLSQKILPIINENDAVAVDEMDHQTRFGDNDTLSALVASTMEADLLILLTDVDGFYNDNPKKNLDAVKFDVLTEVSDELMTMAKGDVSAFSTGGMETKLIAASEALKEGQMTAIMSSEDPMQIIELMQGEEIGTLFMPESLLK